MNLAGKTALVTGGARRLGRVLAETLAQAGCDIALHFNTSITEAEETATALQGFGVRAIPFRADLGQTTQIDFLVAQAAAVFGRIDVLVNNAAVFERHPVSALTEEIWDQTLDLNLKAPFWCARAVREIMLRQGGGKIINLACVGAFRPWANFLPYCVSKAGVVMLTQTLAKAFAPQIQVNAIAPGIVQFPETDGKLPRAPQDAPTVTPQEIAKALLFLLENDGVNGETLVVDGGWRL
ncbi:MAG: SDR family NAD(P)-dependent oxidoreductase [Blastocatellia bacterium]|nr:SDR family NAD(P)-dependent oxidoreductase [Blastocatellia bacterium]